MTQYGHNKEKRKDFCCKIKNGTTALLEVKDASQETTKEKKRF